MARPGKKGSSRKAAKRPRKTATPTRKAKGAKGKSAGGLQALKLKRANPRQPLPDSDEGGPIDWLLPSLASSYGHLRPRGTVAAAGALPVAKSRTRNAVTLTAASPTVWRQTLLDYKRRKAAVVQAPAVAAAPGAGKAMVPNQTNWMPLGPTVVLHGQTVGNQPVGGRTARLAIAPSATVIYAATASGGVFRSSDGGTTWRSLMDRFDLDPASFASASLACGAIAIDSADPNRVYVGTGEGDTYELFSRRVVSGLPTYRGVGVIRSDDGGMSWVPEPSTPDLAGEAFFALAVDPRNRDNVVAATTKGIFRRTVKAGGGFEWLQRTQQVSCDIAVASKGGATRFFAAQWGRPGGPGSNVLYSDDGGQNWKPAGTGLPTQNMGRIALGVQHDKPDLLYAFVAVERTGVLHGLYRLDSVTGPWVAVTNVPDVLPADPTSHTSQGDYDLSIAVDPQDPNLVFLGGSYVNVNPYPASIWRCRIKPSIVKAGGKTGARYAVQNAASIGTHAHADVHSLIHTPDDPTELWCTCDGGVFLNRDPRGSGEFTSQNASLACLCCNFIAQHPTDPNILFTGMQDNGTARSAAGSVWTHVMGGDGGYCVINWANADLILSYANGVVYRSTTGGKDETGWKAVWSAGWATMTQPIVCAPYNPARPADAQIVAIAAAQEVYISQDFAGTWPMTFSIQNAAGTVGDIFAMNFASPTRLFVATTQGEVFRADRAANSWTVTRLDDAASGPLGLHGEINDIAIDWSDAGRNAVYVAFGGLGDPRRVWRYDGAKWSARSGPVGGNCLLDVEHNALAVDPKAPNNVYVGADIGVWHSPDGGANWNPLENGLPDAPVFDLQIHPTQRLLRAATYGRGIYELPL